MASPDPTGSPKTKMACQNCHILDWHNQAFILSYESVTGCRPLQDRVWPWMNGSLPVKRSLKGMTLEAICWVHSQNLGQRLPWRKRSPRETLKSWRRNSAQQRENQERHGGCFQIRDELSCGRDIGICLLRIELGTTGEYLLTSRKISPQKWDLSCRESYLKDWDVSVRISCRCKAKSASRANPRQNIKFLSNLEILWFQESEQCS